MKAKVIPYRQWKNDDGRTASLTGALPAGPGWDVVQNGFTVEWDDGTRGCGRPPFPDAEAAQAFLDRSPRYSGPLGA